MTRDKEAFIDYLERLRDSRRGRAAMAALRRGAGQEAGTVPAMYQYVVPWLNDGMWPWTVQTYYWIASSFALHPAPGGSGNLGDSLRRLARESERSSNVERRLNDLLSTQQPEVLHALDHVVQLLRSQGITINWSQLLRDLPGWGHPRRYVQQQWAGAFWGRAPRNDDDTGQTSDAEI